MMTTIASQPPMRPTPPFDQAKTWKAAKDFEAMAIGEFLKPMFQTVDTAKTVFGGGDAERTWRPMLIDEIGKQMAASGGFGLAAPIYESMRRIAEGT